ncbi:hypothetical protein QL285_003709 [Trifolium repens]|nr:hypothetical protein QL285_003709 [Trifolium repens]
MLQLVEPPKISKVGLEPSKTSRVRKAFRGSKGGEACRKPWIVGGKQFFRKTDRFNSGAEEGKVELVGLSKIPVIVGIQAFLREYGTENSGGRRGSSESCGCYQKSYGSGSQDLHEGGRHSEG